MPSEADNDAMLEASKNGDAASCKCLLVKDPVLSNAVDSVRDISEHQKH
jgi:hypothetical protein